MLDNIKQHIADFNPVVLSKTLQMAQIGAFGLAILTLLLTFYNVSRTQKRNRENDVEKFKRDLNLKASDEMIDAIQHLMNALDEVQKINNKLLLAKVESITMDAFTDELDKAIDHLGLYNEKFYIKLKQRSIIFHDYIPDIEIIYFDTFKIKEEGFVAGLISRSGLKQAMDNSLEERIDKLCSDSFGMRIKLEYLQTQIQNAFLGKIYKSKAPLKLRISSTFKRKKEKNKN